MLSTSYSASPMMPKRSSPGEAAELLVERRLQVVRVPQYPDLVLQDAGEAAARGGRIATARIRRRLRDVEAQAADVLAQPPDVAVQVAHDAVGEHEPLEQRVARQPVVRSLERLQKRASPVFKTHARPEAGRCHGDREVAQQKQSTFLGGRFSGLPMKPIATAELLLGQSISFCCLAAFLRND